MHVEFHGAARTVTGSCTLLEADGTRVLIDCGQFQGDDTLERRNRGGFGFDPRSIPALVLTHSHIDHIGRAPLLTARGFRGEVIATRATKELALVMLMDAAKIQQEDARNGGPLAAYGEKEVHAIYRATRTVKYGQPVKVGKGITVTLSDAGHILGSAHVLATMTEGPRTVAFGVSGDVGTPGRPVVADPTPFRSLDFLQVESTYGDRDHKPQADSIAELDAILDRADGEQGVVLIPAFALGRTQDILYHLNARKNAGGLANLDVYVDSPLATRITRVFDDSSAVFDDDAKGLLRRGDDPFDFPGLHFVGDGRESGRLSREARRCVIIASSGMCQGGRIVGHLEQMLPRPSTRVVIVGYQAPGTLGRRLVNGSDLVRIRGRDIPVRASIHTLGGFSAHAGRHELLDWIRAADRKPAKVFLCHGEPAVAESMAQAIRDELHLATYIPSFGERVEL